MTADFEALVERARTVRMTEEQKEIQRQSFAYGTTKIENDKITREVVERASKAIAGEK